MAVQIQTLQTALSRRLRRVNFEGFDIQVTTGSAVFITTRTKCVYTSMSYHSQQIYSLVNKLRISTLPSENIYQTAFDHCSVWRPFFHPICITSSKCLFFLKGSTVIYRKTNWFIELD